MIKNLLANAGDTRDVSSIQKITWSRKWQPAPVFLPGIPWTEEPSGLQSLGLQRVGQY